MIDGALQNVGPVVTAGDPQSLLLQLITGHEGLDPKTSTSWLK